MNSFFCLIFSVITCVSLGASEELISSTVKGGPLSTEESSLERQKSFRYRGVYGPLPGFFFGARKMLQNDLAIDANVGGIVIPTPVIPVMHLNGQAHLLTEMQNILSFS